MIKLGKSITKEALEAMSRNTIVEGGAVNADVLKAFDDTLALKLVSMKNATLKKAVADAVKDDALEKLLQANVAQVPAIVEQSLQKISKDMGIAVSTPVNQPAARPAYTPSPPRSYGGK